MTTETILTDKVIAEALVKNGTFLSEGELSGYDKDFARAIEQAVLQSEQVQAWKKDAQHERCVRRVKNGGPVYEDNTDYWKKGGWHDVK